MGGPRTVVDAGLRVQLSLATPPLLLLRLQGTMALRGLSVALLLVFLAQGSLVSGPAFA